MRRDWSWLAGENNTLIMLVYLLLMMFVLGTIVGSLLNVCIYRLPLEKSIIWPGSRCGHCLQVIRWYDNLPLISYLVLRGRCRTCRARFSIRYFLLELLTGLSFAGLFYLEVVVNVHDLDVLDRARKFMERNFFPPWETWVIFGHHALLVSFLIAASFCDLDSREIPWSLTVTGTVLGMVASAIWAWPWPLTPAQAMQNIQPGQPWWEVNLGPKMGLYPWPFWGPLPALFEPGGNWYTGLVTGVAGAVVGTLMLRTVRFLFGLGLGIEALGLGDADLMMMAGSFLGWQPVIGAFFLGVFVGLFFGIAQLLFRGDNSLPFGPALAIGIVLAFLGWQWIGPRFQILFFNEVIMLPLAVGGCILMLAASYVLRLLRLMRSK